MAMSTITRYHRSDNQSSRQCSTTHHDIHSSLTTTCPPSYFPDKFQDFFAALTEDMEDLPSMLEDKLIPRYISFQTETFI